MRVAFAAAAIAAMSFNHGMILPRLKYNGPAPRVSALREPTSKLYAPNGPTERTRRKRRIAAGQLQVSV